MKITTRSRYGTRMMLELAKHYHQGPLQIGEISKRQNLSVKYLEQLIIPLKKAGLIKSIRGPKGGHILSRPPEEITVWDVVSVLEGIKALTPCVIKPELCEHSDTCPTRDVWALLTKNIEECLKGITLADLLKKMEDESQPSPECPLKD
ncbi:transcriptional regulator, BadM/Rrf2 family [Thermodesulfatator indicus DSM 15286]|uniref:Transcriptional regulator, BadM/Rrf2 family n=1 Tax=Thermodesulfatator indicus (strain DSM 15286 / JCM 11887 / CIR29812) TaxID=667014 RepID=F8A9E1_THEID|nr:Rrf2 family transcriptional regulator [Thermodesulfatator indicus]AEH44082.1 transcriptional regulator, BadM/Rrf2 family [Thermodesulfatator indicus DSM 15286]